jgi:hypothetical protein
MEVLRTWILCYADVTPYLHIKVLQGSGFRIAPDLATQHRYPRLGPINDWVRSHRLGADGLDFTPLDPDKIRKGEKRGPVFILSLYIFWTT